LFDLTIITVPRLFILVLSFLRGGTVIVGSLQASHRLLGGYYIFSFSPKRILGFEQTVLQWSIMINLNWLLSVSLFLFPYQSKNILIL